MNKCFVVMLLLVGTTARADGLCTLYGSPKSLATAISAIGFGGAAPAVDFAQDYVLVVYRPKEVLLLAAPQVTAEGDVSVVVERIGYTLSPAPAFVQVPRATKPRRVTCMVRLKPTTSTSLTSSSSSIVLRDGTSLIPGQHGQSTTQSMPAADAARDADRAFRLPGTGGRSGPLDKPSANP